MFDQMKKLMEMKKQADQIKRELEASRTEADDGSGIKIVIDGAQRFHSVEIDPSLLGQDNQQEFQKKILKSINYAIAQSQAMAAEKMKKMAGLNIPGL
ncbi:MAG: YbaB/EbfC family nucleoid-associated protein [Candidatus Omnitrophica bacterium]|nr:YbaB/EbfC family nucleoid-associated protein [Candidatus Omnitrophota bacterium]